MEIQAQPGVTVTQTFESVVDTDDEAKSFGEESAKLAHAYIEGFSDYDESV